MRIEHSVSFEGVCEVFLKENPDPTFRSTGYAFRLLEAANKQFGDWFKVILSSKDILGVMLPPHRHEGLDLIPQSGLLVVDAWRKAESAEQSHVCPQRIEELSLDLVSSVFLSSAPVDHPQFSDYRELVRRRYMGLTHLDGLHRLIAWAKSGRLEVVAYVAGSPAADSIG